MLLEARTATSKNYTPVIVTRDSMTLGASPDLNYLVNVDDRVLFKDQNDPSQNGLWVCRNIERTAWTRDAQANTSQTLRELVVQIWLGPYAQTSWILDKVGLPPLLIVGSTALPFKRVEDTTQEVIHSIPLVRPSHMVSLDVTPHGSVVSYAAYAWPEQTRDGKVVVPAIYHHAANTPLDFTATVTQTIKEPEIVEYYWDFGDGIEASTIENTVSHSYSVANLGTIAHVRARDVNGDEAWASLNMMLA